MKQSLVITMAFILAGCAGSATQAPFFEVTSFDIGKMHQVDGRWEIYQSSDDLQYEVNGACDYDGDAYPCMWYGSVISYRTNHPKPVLQCEAWVSDQVDWGNADGTNSEQAHTFNFTLTFDGSETQKRTPNYIIASNQVSAPDRSAFRCQFAGQEVLNYKLTVNYGRASKEVPKERSVPTSGGIGY